MTNEQIILHESLRLMEEGILRGSGNRADGTTVNIELPEPIHTFNGRKALGFSVRKGEREVGSMFQKVAAFFTAAQVEPLRPGRTSA